MGIRHHLLGKNTVSCMRRYPNTPYISKLTGEKNDYYCRQFSSAEILEYSMDEIQEASKFPKINDIVMFGDTIARIGDELIPSVDYELDGLKVFQSTIDSLNSIVNKKSNI